MRHTTINDLEKLLKLSPSTVSRALREHPDINTETKEKALAMSAHNNYQPNIIAQSLRNRRSNTIGVIVQEKQRIEPIVLKTELIVRQSS